MACFRGKVWHLLMHSAHRLQHTNWYVVVWAWVVAIIVFPCEFEANTP